MAVSLDSHCFSSALIKESSVNSAERRQTSVLKEHTGRMHINYRN